MQSGYIGFQFSEAVNKEGKLYCTLKWMLPDPTSTFYCSSVQFTAPPDGLKAVEDRLNFLLGLIPQDKMREAVETGELMFQKWKNQ